MEFALDIARTILCVAVLLGICVLLSSDRKAINWRLVAFGLGLQLVFGILFLKVPAVNEFFQWIGGGFSVLLGFTQAGSEMIFGPLAKSDSFGLIFAFQIIPTVIFFSALTAGLFHLGILQKVIQAIGWVMKRTMQITGAEAIAAAANIFIGQTEAPLVIKPFLPKMSKSEVMALMITGMATVAGGVMAAYIQLLGNGDPETEQMVAARLISASMMNAPIALVVAKILVPEPKGTLGSSSLKFKTEKAGANLLDSISIGITDGLKLAANVAAMLLAFVALMAMFNYLFKELGEATGLDQYVAESTDGKYNTFSLNYCIGVIMSPIAWLMGAESGDMLLVGQLLGEKAILNEWVAYSSLNKMIAGNMLADKSVIISTFALCGFANFSSIGIQIGGISALVPEKRSLLAKLGIKAFIGGTIACLITGTLAGLIS